MSIVDQLANSYRTALRDYEQGRIPQAEENLRRILSQDTRFAPAHHLMGLIREAKGDAKGAQEEFRMAVEYGYQPAKEKLKGPPPAQPPPADRNELGDSLFDIGLFLFYLIVGAVAGAFIVPLFVGGFWLGLLIGAMLGIGFWFFREVF